MFNRGKFVDYNGYRLWLPVDMEDRKEKDIKSYLDGRVKDIKDNSPFKAVK